MTYPIPTAALDDRLGWLGTSGSGKTYNAGGGVERLLQSGARVVIVDPLGVWWGLRLMADGKTASPFNVAIFGGPHGDLPLNEHVGALIGETAATMAESCIVDLSEFQSKAADRRFMAAFLEMLYRKAGGEPFHLVVDEADLFAPQKPGKGDEALLGHMENIVRRGRVRGFIPWLISQRPAVLNKNVLSQVDGLLAFKLTATHDRNALDAWIEGQADVGQAKAIKDALPTFEIGQGVVWLPGHSVLTTATFPPKTTFDSSRTPKRGEKRERRDLKPLDLGALKGRLATVEAEAKANDPRTLKAEVARLSRELAAAKKDQPAPEWPDQRADVEALTAELTDCVAVMDRLRGGGEELQRRQKAALAALMGEEIALPAVPRPVQRAPAVAPARPQRQAAAPREPRQSEGEQAVTGPQRQMLSAIAWWAAMGHDAPTKAQVAAISGWRITSGHLKNVAGSLRTAGLIDYPQPGRFALTDEGQAAAPQPDLSRSFHDSLRGTLTGPQQVVFDYLLSIAGAVSRDDLARAVGWEPTSGHVKNVLGSMRTLEVIDYPERGFVALSDWVTNA